MHYIILYGSYALGEYVDYDQRIEYGLRTCYQSDFDIVVLTPKRKASQVSIDRLLRNASTKIEGTKSLLTRLNTVFTVTISRFMKEMMMKVAKRKQTKFRQINIAVVLSEKTFVFRPAELIAIRRDRRGRFPA